MATYSIKALDGNNESIEADTHVFYRPDNGLSILSFFQGADVVFVMPVSNLSNFRRQQ